MPKPKLRHFKLPLIAAAIGLLVFGGVWRVMENSHRDNRRLEFEAKSEALRQRINERMTRTEGVLRGALGLFEASKSVERGEWAAYVGRLDLAEYPGVLGFGSVRLVGARDLETFLAATRADDAPGFAVQQVRPHGPHYLVEFLAPVAGNEAALGRDLSLDVRAREAAEYAAASGAITMSRPTSIVRADGVSRGFLLLCPVYKKGMPVNSPMDRSVALFGWVYCPIRLDRLLADLGDPALRFSLQENRSEGESLQSGLEGSAVAWTRPVYGERWRLDCASESPVGHSPAALVVLAFGSVITGLSAGVIWSLQRTRRHAEALAQDMTAGLQESENRLRLALRDREEALGKACDANRAKSVFLANMSHEIRTPMNAILGYAQLLIADGSLAPAQRERIAVIDRAGEHLLAIINDILEMAKIESGELVVHRAHFSLPALLDGIFELFAERAQEKGLSLTRECAADLPEWIISDRNKLRQALINLVGNAVKFTDRGRVVVRVLRRDEAREDWAELRFDVADTGPGMSAEECSRLFQPFSQTQVGLRTEGGTGLGLAIARRYARLLDGDITVTSAPGQGSTFSMTVKTGLCCTLPEVSFEAPRTILGLASEQPPVEILVAEDNPVNRELLAAVLTPLGFRLTLVENGAEAVAACESHRFQAVLMDIRMPVMDGREASRRIKAGPFGRETLIIALTASVFDEEAHLKASAQADDYIRKPFNQRELLELLGERLGLRYTYSAPVTPPRG